MASRLKKRLIIQKNTKVADGLGGFTVTWSTFARVWGEIKPFSAKERFFAGKIDNPITHKITIRKLNNMTDEMRIQFDSRIFKILGFINVEEKDRFFEILAEEETGN